MFKLPRSNQNNSMINASIPYDETSFKVGGKVYLGTLLPDMPDSKITRIAMLLIETFETVINLFRPHMPWAWHTCRRRDTCFTMTQTYGVECFLIIRRNTSHMIDSDCFVLFLQGKVANSISLQFPPLSWHLWSTTLHLLSLWQRASHIAWLSWVYNKCKLNFQSFYQSWLIIAMYLPSNSPAQTQS